VEIKKKEVMLISAEIFREAGNLINKMLSIRQRKLRTERILSVYSEIIKLEKRKRSNSYRKNEKFVPKDGVFTYFRYNDKESVMVIINNNIKDQTLDLKYFEESLKGFSKGKEVISGKEFSLQNTLTVPAQTPFIIELEK
jgi:hypothetical protein